LKKIKEANKISQIRYKIKGEHDPAGINDAKTSINSLQGMAKKLGDGFSIGLGIAATKAIGSVATGLKNLAAGSVEAYQTQQKALAGLSNAVRNNANLTTTSFNNIIALTSKLQSKSIYGDEQLQAQAQYLAGLGLTEDQISSTLKASIELASAGIMPLEGAVKNMAKTYNGLGGELSKQIPELKNLTEEQLRSGEAIEIIQRKFANSASTMAQTLEGRTKQFNNLIGDIKEKLGGVAGVFKQLALEKGLPILDDLNEWLEKSMPKIINFFLHLPEVARLTFTSIATMMGKVFTIDFWLNYGRAIGTSLDKILGLALMTIVDNIKAVASIIFQPLDYAWKMFIFSMGTDFAKAVNKVIDGFEKAINLIRGNTEEIRVSDLKDSIASRWDRTGKTYTREQLEAEVQKELDKKGGSIGALTLGRVDESGVAPVNNVGANVGKIFGDNLAKLNQSIALIGEEFSNLGSSLGDAFGDELTDLTSALDAILSKELPDNIKAMLAPAVQAIQDVAEAVEVAATVTKPNIGSDITTGITNDLGDSLRALGGNAGQLADILLDFAASGDYVTAIIRVVGLAIDGLLETLGPPIMGLADMLVKIISDVGRVVGLFVAPLIEVLIPIVEIIGVMLQTLLVPLLQLLSPSIEMIVALIQLVVIPIVKMLAIAFEVLMSPTKYIADIFKWAANQIRIAVHNITEFFKNPLDAKKRNIIDHTAFSSDAFSGLGTRIADIWKMGNTNTSPVGSTPGDTTGRSASYTGQRDITINFSFNNSYVNGDAQEIAIALNKEIENAQKLGLI